MPEDYTRYLSSQPEDLLERLAKLAFVIGQAKSLLARAKAQVERDKARAWTNSQDAQITSRNARARYESVASITEVIDQEGVIAEAETEYDFIRLLLEVRREVVRA